MDSINFAFIVPGSEYDYECRSCIALWKDSDKTPEDVGRIRQEHNSCHGWNHCSIDCCGPCPIEVTGQMVTEAKLMTLLMTMKMILEDLNIFSGVVGHYWAY